ncbi:MAG: hypothetical protein ABIH72_04950, partial [archaeon]
MGKVRDYNPNYGDWRFWLIETALLPLLNRINVEVESEGIDNIEKLIKSYDYNQGVFLTPNHVSWADHILIMKDVNGQVQENRVSSHKFFAPNGQIMAAA